VKDDDDLPVSAIAQDRHDGMAWTLFPRQFRGGERVQGGGRSDVDPLFVQ